MREELPNADADAVIARIAARQHGVVSLVQLAAAGIRRQSVTRRVRSGRLHRFHRGVYAVGHRGLSDEGHWMAAVLACGPKAALSHTSAAHLWRLLPQAGVTGVSLGERSPIHVTVRGEAKHRRGIRVHRSNTVEPGQVTRRDNIPVTTPSRTLCDLRRTLPQSQFAAALRQAEFLGLPIDRQLGPDRTRSELEARFLALCRRHRLPKPRLNVPIGRFVVDFAWVEARLIVELDGYQSHGTRSAFESDRSRDVDLKLLGYDVVRITWRQLSDDSRAVVTALRRLLTA